MATLGFRTAGIVMTVFLVIQLVIGLALAPNTRGKTLEQIERERYGHVVSEDESAEKGTATI